VVTDAMESSRVPVDCCQVPVAAYALAVDTTAMPESSAVTEPAAWMNHLEGSWGMRTSPQSPVGNPVVRVERFVSKGEERMC